MAPSPSLFRPRNLAFGAFAALIIPGAYFATSDDAQRAHTSGPRNSPAIWRPMSRLPTPVTARTTPRTLFGSQLMSANLRATSSKRAASPTNGSSSPPKATWSTTRDSRSKRLNSDAY
jgi:hypothetical protein